MNFLPGAYVYAQGIEAIGKIKTNILNPIFKLLFAAAVLYFIWGVIGFMQNREDEEKKKHLLYGVIGLAVMLSAFGIVNLIGSFLGALK